MRWMNIDWQTRDAERERERDQQKQQAKGTEREHGDEGRKISKTGESTRTEW